MLLADSKNNEFVIDGNGDRNYKDFVVLVGALCKLHGIEMIKKVFEIGLKVYKEDKLEINNIQKYKVSGNSKKSLINQVKQLELPKHVENFIINDIIKEYAK